MTSLRERNKAKRREAILDATLEFLREREFSDVTVEEIAARAEVSPHTVYNLVGTRDELIFALLGRVVRQMASGPPDVHDDAGDPADPVRRVFDHAVDALLLEPVAYRQVVRIGTALPDWPDDGATPPRLISDAVDHLARCDVLAPGATAKLVATHLYLGFVGWLMNWVNGFVGDARFRAGVRRHVSIVLAATTEGPVQDHARAHVLGVKS